MSVRISKSAYIRGLQCPKSLFLEKHNRELKVVSEATQSLFRNGNMVGEVARGLFPGGVMIPNIPGKNGQDKQIRLTREAIESGAEVIYEAAFLHDGGFAKLDILRKGEAGDGWEIHEVKSGTSVSTVYREDVAFQYHVVTGTGLHVSSANLLFINNQYIRQGELDLHELFVCEDATQFAQERGTFVVEELARQRGIIAGDMPEPGIGKHCSNPYECEYKTHCWQHVPEDSVFDIRGNGIDKFSLYSQGIVAQADISAKLLELMNAKQRQQVEATIAQENSINVDAIKGFLCGLEFPICLFDVESFTTPVPMFVGLKPYQQTAFQFSLHVVEENGDIRHHEFLAEPGIDPRESFIKSLAVSMPVEGCVIAFNKSFETAILQGLAKRFPEFDSHINNWIGGMVDLMVPFRKRDVYYWQMKGSYSIKYVLPALVPELTYEGYEIANGSAAMEAYHTMCKMKDDAGKLAQIRANLLRYCQLDTYAMVRLIEALRGLA